MKSHLTYLFLLISIHCFAQNGWKNLAIEDQAEQASSAGNHAVAIKLYQEALNYRKAKYPNGFYHSIDALREVSKALDNLQVEYSLAGNHLKNIELCEELVEWSEKGIGQFPLTPWPYLEYGLAKIQIAESYQSLSQYDKGIEICEELIEYIEETDHNPHYTIVSQQIIPHAHARAGEILKDQGRLEASVAHHQKSVAAWQNTLKDLDELIVHEEIAEGAEICVQRFHKLKDSINVVKYAEIALEHYEILREVYPDNEEYTQEVVAASNSLGNYKSGWGRYEEAIQHYHKSLAIHEEKVAKKENTEDLTQLAALNLQLSRWHQTLDNTQKSAEHLATRIDYLKKLQELVPDTDYSYSISRNQYDLAKKQEMLGQPSVALTALDESIEMGQKSLTNDPENATKSQWQWIQEFYRYQLLRKLKDYETAHGSLDRLENILIGVEEQEPGIQYAQHLKEVEISKRELAYPEVAELDAEIDGMDEGEAKFEKYVILVKHLRKLSKKDTSMQLSYINQASGMGWTGLLAGKFKESHKVLKKAMKVKPVDPYLVTNYAPTLLFLGKYKKAEKVYARYYDKPLTPGRLIIDGFTEDLAAFEEEGIIPQEHQKQVEHIKSKLKEWHVE